VVLGRDRRVDEDLGDVGVLHDLAALLLELVEQLRAVTVVDPRRLGERGLADVLGRRQVTGEEGERDQPTAERQTDEGDQESDQDRRQDRGFGTEPLPLGLLPVRPAAERMIACRRARNASILD
jgi:hypothetical protein